MKAIETEYAGVRFRSRLEARWAVLFDALLPGIGWQYEPEAFEFADGSRYLPDFWISAWSCFVEVKPLGDPCEKARRFARESGKSMCLALGPPGIGGLFDVTFRQGHECGDSGWCAGVGACDDCADQAVRYPRRNWDRAVSAVRAHRFWNPTQPQR